MAAADDDKPDHLGHRERLRERFIGGGRHALQDYELLELLLFHVFRQGDTKPLAKRLIKRFGSFAGVFAAETGTLRSEKGLGDASVAFLKAVQAAAEQITRQEVVEQPVLGSWKKLLDYLRTAMAHNKVEQFRVIFLDNKNGLIDDRVLQEGTINHTPVYPREIMRMAIELHAVAMILVHNHPSGDPAPSEDDIRMTREIIAAAEKLDITVHDHIVIGRKGHASFRTLGLM